MDGSTRLKPTDPDPITPSPHVVTRARYVSSVNCGGKDAKSMVKQRQKPSEPRPHSTVRSSCLPGSLWWGGSGEPGQGMKAKFKTGGSVPFRAFFFF